MLKKLTKRFTKVVAYIGDDVTLANGHTGRIVRQINDHTAIVRVIDWQNGIYALYPIKPGDIKGVIKS